MASKRALIGIGGGIAAYKVCEVMSHLAKAGIEVRAILTQAAQAFITPLTATTLCRHPAYTDQDFWQPSHTRPLHIELGEWADLILLAPLTAHTLAKLTHGLADDLLTNTILASTCPVLLAPAMNTTMWQQMTVQRNWQQLRQDDRYHRIGPAAGMLACDTVGTGRMVEPLHLISYLTSLLHTGGRRDLAAKRILISAGGTREYLDPVRFIGNPATGKMGLALAEAAWHRGAKVTLVHGPIAEPVLAEIEQVAVERSQQMQAALLTAFPQADWLIMAAAVADVKPASFSAVKLAKHELPESLPLEPVPDILAELGSLKQPHQRLVGFAAQTGDILPPARQKLIAKHLDAIAANPIDQPESGFGSSLNQGVFLDRQGRQRSIPTCSKLEMAHALLDFVSELECSDSNREQ
ncbi:MAG: bifunctional phosphopantothenoylcysteine decarboxylase/phosphopantothenate--cysteine ligase CoaBC [Aphanocapsa sp. GSE-SYN-MK-11-07L]|jgi:phosphopantothenoylcysteine decarboxylase/phosphopantothenate--cysteine ligase|nr:bifunctional phosphopantothenoylcysteine decarboxylase/phosphopantothenate--cysteine ligase CoaBC [Aphanocapsa sp. GSE-SYN-MK-11-07L]